MPKDVDDLNDAERDLIDDVQKKLGKNQALWLQDYLTGNQSGVIGLPFVGKDKEKVEALAAKRGVSLTKE